MNWFTKSCLQHKHQFFKTITLNETLIKHFKLISLWNKYGFYSTNCKLRAQHSCLVERKLNDVNIARARKHSLTFPINVSLLNFRWPFSTLVHAWIFWSKEVHEVSVSTRKGLSFVNCVWIRRSVPWFQEKSYVLNALYCWRTLANQHAIHSNKNLKFVEFAAHAWIVH